MIELQRYGGPACWLERTGESLRTDYWRTPEAGRGIVLPWIVTAEGLLLLLVPEAASVRDTLAAATHARLHTHRDIWATGLTLLVHTPETTVAHALPTWHAMSAAMWCNRSETHTMHAMVYAPAADPEAATLLATWPVYCSRDPGREMTEAEHEQWLRRFDKRPEGRRGVGVREAVPWHRDLTPEWHVLPLPRRATARAARGRGR